MNAGPSCGGRPPAALPSSLAGGPGPGPDPGHLPWDDEPEDDEELDEAQRSLLGHESRSAIYDVVTHTPGLNKRQIARRVDLDRSSADQHIKRLEAYDLLVLLPGARDDGEVLCFHPDHAHLWEPEDTRLLYGQAPLRQVALYVHGNPGTTTDEIAEELEKAPKTIQEHLVTLRAFDLVESHRFRRRVEHHPTTRLDEWADTVGDCYRRPWTQDS